MKNKYGISTIDKLREYSKEYFLMDYYGTNFPDNAYQIGIATHSDTFRSLINWMEQAIKNYENKINQYTKFVIFSAHDSTIGALESLLRYVFKIDLNTCSFADSRYFELYIDDNGNYQVRYLKGDNTIKLNIKFSEFKQKINDIIWTKEEVLEYCKLVETEDIDKKTIEISIMIILIIINVILFIFFLCFYFNKKEEKI